jgi:AcrR family transcriptional regulator
MKEATLSPTDAPLVPATRERILDAAERQFADYGYEGASMRQITAEAGVNLAAANYHFGDKESLYAAVFERRIRVINAERVRRLGELEHAGTNPTVTAVVRVILDPMRDLWLGAPDGQPHPFLRCMARTLLDPQPFMRTMVAAEFAPLFARLFPAVQRALPGLAMPVVIARMQAMMGATLFTGARMARLGPAGPAPASEPLDPGFALEELIAFCVAGLSAPSVAAPSRPGQP